MRLPEEIKVIASEVLETGLLDQLIEQLNKDARLSGLQLELERGISIEKLVSQLIDWITRLLNNDPTRIVDLMYRIDVPEKAFRDRRDVIQVEEVVGLLLQRTWLKVRFRNRIQ